MASTIAIAGVLACLGLQSAAARPQQSPDNGSVTVQAPKAPKIAPISRDPAVLALPGDAAALGGYNVLIADRGNNRLLLVNPQKQILWEYHFKDIRPGSGPGLLDHPDDAYKLPNGNIMVVDTRPGRLIEIGRDGKIVWDYTGKVSADDLPVIGTGVQQMRQGGKYLLQGKFVDGGFKASNGSPCHLELNAPPVAAKP